jgi:hypothetical protein
MKVRIGVDPYVSSGDDFKLIKEVITSLHREGIYDLAQVACPETSSIWQQDWKKIEKIRIDGQEKRQWEA